MKQLYEMSNAEIVDHVSDLSWENHSRSDLVGELAYRLSECQTIIERYNRIIDGKCTNTIFTENRGKTK